MGAKTGVFDAGVNHSNKSESTSAELGLTAIGPDTYFRFCVDNPVITVIVKQTGHVISRGATPGKNKSVIVTPELTLVNAFDGQIWYDSSGKCYKRNAFERFCHFIGLFKGDVQ